MVTTKTPTRTLLRITKDNAHGLVPGWIVQVIGGDVPAGLRKISEPYDLYPDQVVRTIDAAQFAKDVETSSRRSERPSLAPDPMLEYGQVVAKYFGGDRVLMETAQNEYGFPRMHGRKLSPSWAMWGRDPAIYNERHIEEWRERFTEFVRAMKPEL